MKNKLLNKLNTPLVQMILLLLIVVFAPLIEKVIRGMYIKFGLKINDSVSQTIVTAALTLLTVNLTSKFNMSNQKKSIFLREFMKKVTI